MNVWKWVNDLSWELSDSGQERLADLIDEVPGQICSGEHTTAECLIDEALAMPACQENPWLNVYFRHWRLQSRILHRLDASHGAVEEAVRLVEYCSREDARDCPQSICAVQDLTSAYAIKDGPGFAQERKAVSAETLARIDPSWSCFHCISAEYADALIDAGEYEEADRFCAIQYSRSTTPDEVLLRIRAKANLRLGRVEKAYELVRDINGIFLESSRNKDVRLARALCLAHLGKAEEAIDLLPSFDDIEASQFDIWLECLLCLSREGRNPFNSDIGRVVNIMTETLRAHESLYYLAHTYRVAAEIALHAGDFTSARAYLVEAHSATVKLRRPEKLRQEIKELEAMLDGEQGGRVAIPAADKPEVTSIVHAPD